MLYVTKTKDREYARELARSIKTDEGLEPVIKHSPSGYFSVYKIPKHEAVEIAPGLVISPKLYRESHALRETARDSYEQGMLSEEDYVRLQIG